MMKAPVIFVIDKNPVHRNLIKYNLEINKLTNVHSFPSGEECLYRLQKEVFPDFLITSFYTGSHNGFDLLQSVLAISPATRVVFFDAFEDPLLGGQLMDAGACDYVMKTRNPDAGISQLLKNIHYIIRENSLVIVS